MMRQELLQVKAHLERELGTPLLTELDDIGGEGRASRSPRCGRSALYLHENAGEAP